MTLCAGVQRQDGGAAGLQHRAPGGVRPGPGPRHQVRRRGGVRQREHQEVPPRHQAGVQRCRRAGGSYYSSLLVHFSNLFLAQVPRQTFETECNTELVEDCSDSGSSRSGSSGYN